jgi:hypothetical protein
MVVFIGGTMHASLLTAHAKIYNLPGELLQESKYKNQHHAPLHRLSATVLLAYQDQELANLKQFFQDNQQVLEAHSWQEVVTITSDRSPQLLLIDCKLLKSALSQENPIFQFSEPDQRPPNVVFLSCDTKLDMDSDWEDIKIHNLDEFKTVLQNLLYVHELEQQNVYLSPGSLFP